MQEVKELNPNIKMPNIIISPRDDQGQNFK